MTNAVSTEIQHAQTSENNTRENTGSSGQFKHQWKHKIKASLPLTTHKVGAEIEQCNSLHPTPYVVIGLFSFLWFTAKTWKPVYVTLLPLR